jgi:hypothetical protein
MGSAEAVLALAGISALIALAGRAAFPEVRQIG